jgi:DNA invertase Pin-like site-specific DNA recombinase
MLFQMCGVFAEFERAIISERVRAGLERVRANGPAKGKKAIETAPQILIQRLPGAYSRCGPREWAC